MRLPPREALLLRIFLGEDDRAGGRPLYEALVLKAREMRMAGAIDSQENIDAFLGAIEPIIGSGLVTLEKATIIRYGEGRPPGR